MYSKYIQNQNFEYYIELQTYFCKQKNNLNKKNGEIVMSEKIVSTKYSRLIMAITCLAFGIYMIVVHPMLIGATYAEYLNFTILEGPPPKTFLRCVVIPMFWYFYRGIGILMGVILVCITYSLLKGASWAWPMAITCIGTATIFTVQPFVQHVAHVTAGGGGMAPCIPSMFVGVVAFLIVLVLPRSGKKEKLARLSVFTLLGIEGGLVSVYIVQSTMKMTLMGSMAAASSTASIILNPDIAILAFSWPLQVFTTGLLIAAMFGLAKRTSKGYWYAIFAGVLSMVANYPTQIVRMETVDFFIGGTLGLLIVVCLLIPAVKNSLIDEVRE